MAVLSPAGESLELYYDRLVIGTGPNPSVRAGDVVLVAVGVRPHTELARKAGIPVNARGAIVVDDRMRTNLEDVSS